MLQFLNGIAVLADSEEEITGVLKEMVIGLQLYIV